MRERQRSRTAEATAVMRAIHQVVDAEPRVFDDPVAARLLRLPDERWRRSAPVRAERVRQELRRAGLLPSRPAIGARRLRAQLVVRARYAEDQLQAAIERGVTQYVVLAAGLDTFALRRTDLQGTLTVFEVDHPGTQADKRRRIESAGLDWPGNLELVPIDFEHQSLSEALHQSSFDDRSPAFFSWLGVTYYLTREAICQTLRCIAERAAGSDLVLDYWRSQAPLSLSDRALLNATRMAVRAQAEPMLSFFEPHQLRELAAGSGLELVDDLSATMAGERYLAGRRDGLVLPGFAHLAHLAVAEPEGDV